MAGQCPESDRDGIEAEREEEDERLKVAVRALHLVLLVKAQQPFVHCVAKVDEQQRLHSEEEARRDAGEVAVCRHGVILDEDRAKEEDENGEEFEDDPPRRAREYY